MGSGAETRRDDRSYFFIGSRGFCGTHWLASALNLHPQIYATHSLGPHNKLREEYTDREILENGAESVRNHWKNPVEVLTRQARADRGDALPRFLGNVHGYPFERLVRLRKRYGVRFGVQRVRLANLVRHPVDWVASGAANWRRQATFSVFARRAIIECLNRSGTLSTPYDLYDMVLALSREHGFDLMSWDTLAFVYCCETLPSIAADHAMARKMKVPEFRMEDLTQRPTELTVLVAWLTASAVLPGAAFHRAVEKLQIRNSHRRRSQGAKRARTKETWAAWEPWQRTLFQYCRELSKLNEMCDVHGYDLSFTRSLR